MFFSSFLFFLLFFSLFLFFFFLSKFKFYSKGVDFLMLNNNLNKKVSPAEGGCWFCHTVSDGMAFDYEFDTYVHLECVRKALEDSNHPSHEEARFMSYLLEEDDNCNSPELDIDDNNMVQENCVTHLVSIDITFDPNAINELKDSDDIDWDMVNIDFDDEELPV
jgi:hypothetical protein